MTGTLERLIAEWVKGEVRLDHALREFERRYIVVALKENQGNRSLAARKLGIHRNTLINKVKSHNIRAL
ncbi:MAG TPA: helix-turn-helix domain-containing protein [Candidatus Polarisedimenticolia bacterium]|nr:helix-turn-helix domain-containing protein [Candidatus Polarisedimenticolia bacterium]